MVVGSAETDRVRPTRARVPPGDRAGGWPITDPNLGLDLWRVAGLDPKSQKVVCLLEKKEQNCELTVESKKLRVDPRMGRGSVTTTKVGVSIREERVRNVSGWESGMMGAVTEANRT